MEPRTILVVEDDSALCEGLAEILQQEGYRPLIAATCAEGLSLAMEQHPGLVLLDLKLPDGSGAELLTDLKRVCPESACIVMTASADVDSAVATLTEGAFHYLQKPVRPGELLRLLSLASEAIQLREGKRRAEDNLRSTNRHLRAAFDAIEGAIAVVDLDFVLTDLNQAMLDAFDLPDKDSLIGRKCFEALKGREEPCPYCVAATAFRTNAPACRKSLPQDGTMSGGRTFEIFAYPISDEEGNVTGAVEFARDITERKRAEEALSTEKDRAQNYLDVAGVMLVALDAEQRVTLINRKGCSVLGRCEKEIVGKNWFDLAIPEPERERVKRVFATLLAGEIEPVEHFENRVVTKRNEERLIAWHNTVLKDPAGNIVGVLSSGEDITERRQTTEALRESEERYRLHFENVSDVVYSLDAEFRFLSVSPSVEQILGYRPDELVGKQFMELNLLAPEYLANALSDSMRVFAGERISPVVYEFIAKDGSRKVGEISAVPIFRDGKVVATASVARDITARKRAEEELGKAKEAAEAANLAKSQFLANMSHEIRTPMTAIMGFTDLLMTYEVSAAERHEHLQTVHRNSQHLLDLINNILDLSKIEADKAELEAVDCSPQQIVEEVRALLQVRADEKELSLNVDYTPPIPVAIRTDPSRLRQILVNLVGNAIKFTKQGGVSITVRCVRETGGLPQIQFDVADTGIGMTAETISGLFQPFTQADVSTTRRFGGTGLGLSISEKLAKMLGGGIEVHSALGKGTTFTLSIDPGPLDDVPMLEAFPTIQIEEDRTTAAVCDRELRGRVLMAEDAQDVRQLVGRALRKWGLAVDFAENGRVAQEKALAAKAAGESYDLILMDVQMPEMDGHEAARRLRRDGWDGPIVALTAEATAGDWEKCSEAGYDGYITKPITLEALRKRITPYLGRVAHAESVSSDEHATTDRPSPQRRALIGEDAKAELLAGFVRGLPSRVAAVEESLRANELETLARLAHQLKGSAGTYGILPVAQAAGLVEQHAARPSDLEQLQAAVSELVDLCRHAAAGERKRLSDRTQ